MGRTPTMKAALTLVAVLLAVCATLECSAAPLGEQIVMLDEEPAGKDVKQVEKAEKAAGSTDKKAKKVAKIEAKVAKDAKAVAEKKVAEEKAAKKKLEKLTGAEGDAKEATSNVVEKLKAKTEKLKKAEE